MERWFSSAENYNAFDVDSNERFACAEHFV